MKRTTMALMAVTLAVLVGTAARANDEQIATQIIQRLQQQKQASQLEGFNIGVQVEQGTVTVMGTVSQTEHALLALDIARRVPGVKLVVNDLYVQPTSGGLAEAPTPAALTNGNKSPTVSAPSSAPITGLELAQPTPPAAPTAPQVAAAQLPTSDIGTGASFVAPPLAALAPPVPAAPAAETLALKPATPQAIIPVSLPQPVASPQPVAPQPLAASQPAMAPRPMPQQPRAAAPQAGNAARRKPVAFAPSRAVAAQQASFQAAPEYRQAAPAQYMYESASTGAPMPMAAVGGGGVSQASYDNPQMPGYAWPSYAAYPNYAALTYPHQYSATAWPYIGPFYPYPQVPLGWRKVTLEWDDGWWFLDFKSKTKH